MDELDAVKVNGCWRQLPERNRLMVKFAILYREHHRATCRKLHIGWRLYDAVLDESLGMLKELASTRY